MANLNKLSPAALSAALRGGTERWGERASIREHIGYVEPQDARRGHYRKCRCGCGGKAKFRAMFNGICMYEGCEMQARYEIQVQAQCPVNPADTDLYDFTIESERIIEVEKIVGFFNEHAGKQKVFQESLTQQCAVTLGAKVKSVGWHSGVKVTCEAP